VAEVAFLFAMQQTAQLIGMKRIGSIKPLFPEAVVRSAGALWPAPTAAWRQVRRSRIGIAGRDFCSAHGDRRTGLMRFKMRQNPPAYRRVLDAGNDLHRPAAGLASLGADAKPA
jgi:hypothetical protein